MLSKPKRNCKNSRENAEHGACRFLFPKQATVGSRVSALSFNHLGLTFLLAWRSGS